VAGQHREPPAVPGCHTRGPYGSTGNGGVPRKDRLAAPVRAGHLSPGAGRSAAVGSTPEPPARPATGRPGGGPREQLRRSLLPLPPPRREGVRGRLALAVVVLVAVPVTAWRLPLATWDSIWAEDGHVFLQAALDEPFWHTVTTPYAGYLHLAPRVVAELVSALPLAWAGYAFTVAAAVLVVWVATTVWVSAAGPMRSVWLRGALALAVVVVPAGGSEAAGNVANSHFFLMFGAFWALLGRPRSRAAELSGHVLVLVAALSDPVTVALLPVAVARLVLLPGRRERALSITFLVGTAVQLAAVAGARRTTGGSTPGPWDVVLGYDLRVVLPHLMSTAVTERVASRGAVAVGLVATAALLLALVLGLALARRNRLAALAAATASGAFFVVASVFSLGAVYPPVGDGRYDLTLSARYTIVPGLLLVSAVVLLADGAASRVPPRTRPVLLALATTPVLLVAVLDHRQPDDRIRQGPAAWSARVAELQHDCSQDPTTPARDVEVQPGGAWLVRLDCADAGG